MFARLSSSKKEFGSCKRKEEEGAARPLPPTSEACSVVPIHAEYKAKARKKERLTNCPSVRPSVRRNRRLQSSKQSAPRRHQAPIEQTDHAHSLTHPENARVRDQERRLERETIEVVRRENRRRASSLSSLHFLVLPTGRRPRVNAGVKCPKSMQISPLHLTSNAASADRFVAPSRNAMVIYEWSTGGGREGGVGSVRGGPQSAERAGWSGEVARRVKGRQLLLGKMARSRGLGFVLC